VVTDSQGRVVQMMGSAQDVTEQKKAEARLLENQNFIKKVANSTPAIISTFEVDSGRYTFMNLGLEKNLNYTLQEVMSRGVSFFSELVHPDDAAELVNRHQEILLEANQLEAGNEEEVFDYRYRLKHQNGQYRWLHTFGTVFERTRSNHVKQILNISLDITERIEAEQVLLQRTRELQQSNASLEEFAYITSHDLKEPLRKISLFVERLAALRTSCTEEEGLYYEKILDASERMRQMIDDILSLSLVSKKWKMERVDLQKVMDEVLCALDEEIRMKGAVVEVDDLPVMQAITPQIGQLFHNLISNSLKFCRPEVSPCIHIRHNVLMPSEVRSPVTPASRYIQIVFSDNGIGFDNNFQEKIFAVFQRLHHRHQYEGTGIGLAICKKIVTNHGGAITASGRIGEGAEFSVILPM
jgi:PAS domain S-box-containing protein